MSSYLKTVSPLDDASLAVMALAGIREINQTAHAAGAGVDSTYTVTGDDTRRVMFYCAGTGADAIRMRANATAAATDMPLASQKYVFYSAVAGETVHFYNTATAAATIYAMEIA
jgi:hypothetical protein